MYVLKQKNSNWWIADWEGDPPRTLKLENAKRYKTVRGANIAKTYFLKRFSHIRKIDLEVLEDV